MRTRFSHCMEREAISATADMYPYNYAAMQATSWLWVSEGITDYYADPVALVRGGVINAAAEFLGKTNGKMRASSTKPRRSRG